ncbi:MAG: hypothetical protein K0S74_4 [Chlamydiales bacterium]|jgi:trk system potassium uptake protein TrkH|nr:hypothetical protein [Chlamydiales bacterium]
MLYKEIYRILARYLYVLSATLMIPFSIATYYEFLAPSHIHPQPHSTYAFLLSTIICLIIAGFMHYLGRKACGQLYQRESIAIAVLVWFITAAIAALPFYLSNTIGFLDSYFEAVSGLTTTGATIMEPKVYDEVTGTEILISASTQSAQTLGLPYYGTINPVRDKVTGVEIFHGIEAVGKALLFWRSFLQWLGGMGILMLFIALISRPGIGGKLLYQAEIPGPVKESLTPRITETVSNLWKIYLILSFILVTLLYITNKQISLFDSITLAFSTISTGGFSNYNYSLFSFKNELTEWIVIIFMFLGGINFAFYFYYLKGKFNKLLSPELFIYLTTLFIGSIIIAYNIRGIQKVYLDSSLGVFSTYEAIRYGLLHYISAQTSTGFAIINYETWPDICKLTMFLGMYLGGMAGSTSGGIKIARFYMLYHILKGFFRKLIHPKAVYFHRANSDTETNQSDLTILTFFVLFLSISAISTFVFVIDRVDINTAVSIVACMINNTGLSFGSAGPTESCAFLSPLSKMLCIFLMIFGRLECFALLITCMPSFWSGK